MVEGHQCHRVAAAHRRLLVGKRFQAKSPNGRFQQGAEAVDGKVLSRIEVIGKNMFYFFGGGASPSASPMAVQLSGQAPVVPQTSSPPKASPSTAAPSPPLIKPTQAQGAKSRRRRSSKGPDQQQSERAEHAKEIEEVVWIEDDDETAGAPGQEAGPSSAQQQQREVAVVAAGRDGSEPVVVRIHFGMSGAFKVSTSLPGPEPTSTTRLSLTNREQGLVGHLSAMTVEMGGEALFKDWEQKLGPDPLREDADGERLWRAMQTSKKPVGLALMTQEMIAGLGNIYRAEVLFKAGVHPEQPCRTVSRPSFDLLWHHSVSLLQRGFSTGSIITVDPEEAKKLGKPWTRRYIYNQRQCGRCKGTVRTWDMAARTVYCCETCQPLLTDAETPAAGAPATPGKGRKASEEDLVTPPPKRGNGAEAIPSNSSAAAPKRKKPRARKADAAAAGATTEAEEKDEGYQAEDAKPAAASLLSPARLAAMQAAVPARVFQSHCAHDDEETMQAKLAQMGSDGVLPRKAPNADSKQTVAQLKEALKARGLSTTGTKAVLLERLAAAEAVSADSLQPLNPEAVTETAPAAAAAAAAAAGSTKAQAAAALKERESPAPASEAATETAPAPAAAAAAAGSSKAKAAAALKERASPAPFPAKPATAAAAAVTATGPPQNSKRRGYKAPAETPNGEDEVDRAERLLAEQLGVPGADTLARVTPAEGEANNAVKAEDKDSSQPRNKKQRTTATDDISSANPTNVVKPGTQGLPMASPEEAAREKAEAGENRAVEHVPF